MSNRRIDPSNQPSNLSYSQDDSKDMDSSTFLFGRSFNSFAVSMWPRNPSLTFENFSSSCVCYFDLFTGQQAILLAHPDAGLPWPAVARPWPLSAPSGSALLRSNLFPSFISETAWPPRLSLQPPSGSHSGACPGRTAADAGRAGRGEAVRGGVSATSWYKRFPAHGVSASSARLCGILKSSE